jgi:hypothetical protein
MRLSFVVSTVALTLVAACGTAPQTYRDLEQMGQEYQRPPQNAEEATRQDTCAAARFRHLVGTEARAIDEAALPPRTRIITPDMMITQDFSPTRLNIIVGTNGRVGSLRCF